MNNKEGNINKIYLSNNCLKHIFYFANQIIQLNSIFFKKEVIVNTHYS